MNNQVPFMPGWQGNPNFQGGFPPNFGRCNCREELNQLDNRISRVERQVRRLENRVSRLERGFPVPLTANVNDDYGTSPMSNEQNFGPYRDDNMYMM